MSEGIQYAGEFSIGSCELITSSGLRVNIRDSVLSITLFENLKNPMLTGSINIQDSFSLPSIGPLIGQEYLALKIMTPSVEDNDKVLDFTENIFHIYKIGARQSAGEGIQVHTLNFISSEALKNERVRVSRTLTGSQDEIVKQMLGDVNCKKNMFIEPSSTSKKYISPNVNPFKVIDHWGRDTRGRVATEFVLGGKCSSTGNDSYDGVMVQAFPIGGYGWHLGKTGSGHMNRHSTGIEICAFGYLKDGKTYVNTTVREDQIYTLKEPFRGLFTQGMVCHETYKDINNNWLNPNEVSTNDKINYFKKDNPKEKVYVGPSESMSKSRKNTIDPEEIIENFGSDAVRLFIISDSPPEKDVQWSEEGIISTYKFIQKLWVMHNNIILKIKTNTLKASKNEDLERFTSLFINKVTLNLEKFRYNVIVANLYEMYNFLSKEIEKPIDSLLLKNNYLKILKIMTPLIPHFASECLSQISIDPIKEVNWPSSDKSFLERKTVNIVIQINGKKKEVLKLRNNISEDEIMEIILKNEKLKSLFNEKEITKKIFVPNRLINLIVKN